METMPHDYAAEGIRLLRHPTLPLVRMLSFLYLAGPFTRITEVLAELKEPIETGTALYQDPASHLERYLPVLEKLEGIKRPAPLPARILDESLSPLEPLPALTLWVAQEVLVQELEKINGLLCRPCGCTFCCTGPEAGMRQRFFEIPLGAAEVEDFPLERIDTELTRSATAHSEPPLLDRGRPFYENREALYRWRDGWSLILPTGSACPHLQAGEGLCRIYPKRPEVCRRPPIFPYVLERSPAHDGEREGKPHPAYVARHKLLAVWDCPFVRVFQKDIIDFAAACELEPVFRENKG